MKESEIQSQILQYLAAKGILAFRQNTGAMQRGKRVVRFGVPGQADILSFRENTTPVWIEVKTEAGKQSEFQKSFQKMVEDRGMTYRLVRSVDDLEGIF